MVVETQKLELERYEALMGQSPRRIPHWEHWSCPDAESYLTGVDYYEHPKLCRERLLELYPSLAFSLTVPKTDDPISRPKMDGDSCSADREKHTVRWGDGETGTFEHGEAYFKSAEDVFSFSPLEKEDYTDWPHVVMNWDYSSEDAIYERLRKEYPSEWGDKAPVNSCANNGFYNTMFMWPMLTFGWELFLECCMDDRFARIMDEFAELSRRVFRAMSRLPINFVICHDDIVMASGPVCSPAWMKKHIFPRYEEYWDMLRSAGKEVIFMVDGCIDAYVDDVMACGARGIISEPFTDYKEIARKHKNCFIAGEGDSRILTRKNPDEIRVMVESMVETAKMSGGYMMCIGNHIPWNVPPEGIKLYLDLCSKLAVR